ncbi:MAG: nucleotide exchange factor GrpE [Bacteroidetes bacterium]|nr:nucleotide exchange factor GrpE [Bacteroidota bacterium]
MKKTNDEKIQAETPEQNEEVKNGDGQTTESDKNSEQTADASKDVAAQIAELNDKYLRLYSEFDNYRRRTAKEKLDMMKSASADLLTELLPIADDFDRTVGSFENVNEKDMNAIIEGIVLVHNKFKGVLEKQGLKFFEAKEQPFDPDFHEAITKIPAPSSDLKGKVVDVIEKGYMLNDKVLRYAKVVVGE